MKLIDKDALVAKIERFRKTNKVSEDKEYAQYELDVKCGYDMALDDMLSCINSLSEEPESEDICNQCEAHHDKDKCDELVFGHNCPIVTTSEDLEEASEEYTGKVLERTNMLIGNQPVGEEIEAAFKAGAQWQKEQFEKNRLAACDAQTEEEAEIEQSFVMGIIENEHRQPTFDDAIKYGMRLQKKKMMEEAIDVEVKVDAGGYPYVDKTIELYDYDKDIPLAKMGDKYKVVLIKEG